MFVLDMFNNKLKLPTKETALPGRDEPIDSGSEHFLFHRPLHGPYPEGTEMAMFGMGCFWGAERKFWQLEGVHITAVGYAAGISPNPTYKEVCSGLTGHNEVVFIVYHPDQLAYDTLLKTFWENHDPTQGMKQGNDVGTQYRSGIYTYTDAQKVAAEASRKTFASALKAAARPSNITTEIIDAPAFYFAEEYHQQYLEKNPGGYCGLGGTGVSCPIGLGVEA